MALQKKTETTMYFVEWPLQWTVKNVAPRPLSGDGRQVPYSTPKDPML